MIYLITYIKNIATVNSIITQHKNAESGTNMKPAIPRNL